MTPDRRVQLQRALDDMGNTHSFEDIVALIEDGLMQSFAEGDTWAVTQIIDFPRKRVLEVFLVVGDMIDAEKLHDRVFEYAKGEGCDIVRAFGRRGFHRWAQERGWKNGQQIFIRELS